MIVMTTKVIFQSLSPIYEEVIMRFVICRTVIIVDIFLRRVVVNEEIVVNLAPGHLHGRLACTNSGQKRLS